MDENSSPIERHFQTAEQQRDASTLGMWIFLGTEVLFFGALFMAYTFLRWSSPLAVSSGSEHLHLVLGSINTAVLLTSSFVMTVGMYFNDRGRRRLAAWMLILTAAMGMLFLTIKGTEYVQVSNEGFLPKVHHHHTEGNPMPGGLIGALGTAGTLANATPEPATELFFWLYFVMTGLHAVHVIIGVVMMLIVAAMLRQTRGVSNNTVHNAGLYWHFVDVVWIFLFPLLYLAGHWKL